MKSSKNSLSPYQAVLDKIYKLGRFGIKLELDTIQNILKRLGNPHKNYNIVHIAGTNGKGSTGSYIASILQKAGFKTGFYTSPHLVRFNERITINGIEISDDAVVSAYKAVERVDIGKRKATFFETATAMGFYHFAKKNVDWAVIETGMGGRFDATNVVQPQVSVITNLSIEHTEYLGNTIKALANEKGGIIKEGTPVITGVSQASGLQIIKKIAEEKKATLYIYKRNFCTRKQKLKACYNYEGLFQPFTDLKKSLPGKHQKENMSLALAAIEIIFSKCQKKDSRYLLTAQLIKEGLISAKWPGRLENIMENPLIILDGAHNLKASKVLGKHLSATLADKKLTLILGILDDKPYEKMLEHLVPFAHKVIITKAKIDRSLPADTLKKSACRLTSVPVDIVEDVKNAVKTAIDMTDKADAICIAGSLYVAGEAKELFDEGLFLAT